MNAQSLPDKYRQVYDNLKNSVNYSSRKGIKDLPVHDIEDFSHHYLIAIGILSRLRANPALRDYVQPFQKLLLEANILLYPEETLSLKQFFNYLWTTVPAQLWENRYFTGLSVAICGLSSIIGFIIVLQHFEMAEVFLGGMRDSRDVEAYLFSVEAQRKMLQFGRESSDAVKSTFAVFLMINNIKVTLLCFTMGALFAIPTLLILIQTGLMLGALPALFYKGDLYGLGAWLLPHGVPEISSALLGGSAGLKLGFSMLTPSPNGMATQFRTALKNVAGTAIVCAILMIWAGLVESFIRQSTLSNEIRYLIAGVSVIPLLLLYWRGYIAYQQSIKPISE